MKYKIIAVLCAAALMLGAAGCGNAADKGEKKAGSDQSMVEPEDKTQGIKTDSSKKDNDETGSGDMSHKKQVVTGGFQLTLPEYVTPSINDQGLILSDEDMNYQMLVTVRDYGFDSKKETPDFFSEKAEAAGYEITKEVELTKVEDREFAYFNYIDQGDNMLLSYSKADEENTFGVLVLRYGELNDEEILKQVSEILDSAEKTDLPDTAADDAAVNNAAGSEESTLPEDAVLTDSVSMLEGEKEISVNVPETFYLMDDMEKNTKIFISSNGKVDAYLHVMEELAYEGMEEWVKDSISVPEGAQNVSKTEVQKEQPGDTAVYYQAVSYEEESSYKEEIITYTELVAVCKMPNGVYLELKAYSRGDNGLNFDMIKKFFTLSAK